MRLQRGVWALVKMAEIPKYQNFSWPITIEKMEALFSDWLIAQQILRVWEKAVNANVK